MWILILSKVNSFCNFHKYRCRGGTSAYIYEIPLCSTDKLRYSLVCCLKQFLGNLRSFFPCLCIFLCCGLHDIWKCQNDYSRHSKRILENFVVNSLKKKKVIQSLPEDFKTESVWFWRSLQHAVLWLNVLRWCIWQWINFSCWVIFLPVVCLWEALFAWFVTLCLIKMC